VTAACPAHIQLPRLPPHVRIIGAGPSGAGPSSPPGPTRPQHHPYLRAGDQLRIAHPFSFVYAGNRLSATHAQLRARCSTPPRVTINLVAGRLHVATGPRPARALIATREMVAFATRRGTRFVVERNRGVKRTTAWTLNQPIVAERTSDPTLRIDTRVTYTAISDAAGIRLDIWPFSLSRLQRPTTPADGLPAYWADGFPCSVGCTPAGVIPGWPLKPFGEQHAIRAGINELRPANFHVGVDIEATFNQPAYALQSGTASIRYPGMPDVNVDVGHFYYWHIQPSVHNGQHVTAYRTVLGHVLYGFKHVALSEVSGGQYLNPLRPGGSLRPYRDTEPPVIGLPRVFADGHVEVAAFDPQSFVEKASYETPVLAPSSLAWRLYDAAGRPLTGLEWAMRGSQNYPPGLKRVIFSPGASNPGFACFFRRRRCIPNWTYWLAGGLTPPLPLGSLPRGRYRLTVYAWDWAGNTSALDYPFTVPLGTAEVAPASSEFGPLDARFDYP
jgi:hypothetical protein